MVNAIRERTQTGRGGCMNSTINAVLIPAATTPRKTKLMSTPIATSQPTGGRERDITISQLSSACGPLPILALRERPVGALILGIAIDREREYCGGCAQVHQHGSRGEDAERQK